MVVFNYNYKNIILLVLNNIYDYGYGLWGFFKESWIFWVVIVWERKIKGKRIKKWYKVIL